MKSCPHYPVHDGFTLAWRRLACLSVKANSKRLSNPDRQTCKPSLSVRFRIDRLGTDLLHPAFHTSWAQMLAWTVCIGCLVHACFRERAYPTNSDWFSLPTNKGPPLIDPLDVTLQGFRLQALGLSVSLLFRRAASEPGALNVWDSAPSGGRAPSSVMRLYRLMPWQSSFP